MAKPGVQGYFCHQCFTDQKGERITIEGVSIKKTDLQVGGDWGAYAGLTYCSQPYCTDLLLLRGSCFTPAVARLTARTPSG